MLQSYKPEKEHSVLSDQTKILTQVCLTYIQYISEAQLMSTNSPPQQDK